MRVEQVSTLKTLYSQGDKMSQDIEDINNNQVKREHKSLGQNLFAIFKFTSFTLIKMVLVVIAAAAWFASLFGIVIKTMGKNSPYSYIKHTQEEQRLFYHLGTFLSGPFILIKNFCNSYLRDYFWPAVGGLVILAAISILLNR